MGWSPDNYICQARKGETTYQERESRSELRGKLKLDLGKMYCTCKSEKKVRP